jgi:flavin-dependent dehydrogenase
LGLRVELFERARFPREKPCGEGLMPGGVAVLRRLGLAEQLGGAPFHGVRYHFAGRVAGGPFPTALGETPVGLGFRRGELDKSLFEAAAATRGVTAHTGTQVEAAILDRGRVVGLRAGGADVRAPLVVAADGVRSRLRHQLGLDVAPRRRRVGMRVHFQLAPGHQQPPWVDVFVARGYELYVTPLPRNELLVAALTEPRMIAQPAPQQLREWVAQPPELAERLEGAQQLTPLQGVFPLGARARRGYGPGIVLLGDAAGFIDPVTGGGMSQALMTAELLAAYAARGVERCDEWLPEFDRRRRAMLRDYERLTRAMLWLTQFPALANSVLRGVTAVPGLFSHLVGVAGGMRTLAGGGFNLGAGHKTRRHRTSEAAKAPG